MCVQIRARVKWKVMNENWCSLVCPDSKMGGYTYNLLLTGNNVPAFVGSVALTKKKDRPQSKCILWQLTGTPRQPGCWCVLGQASGKKHQRAACFSLADRNALHPAHKVFSAMLILHSLLLPKRPTHMQVLTVAKMFALTVRSRAAALLCRQTNSLSFCSVSVHPNREDWPSPAGCCSLFSPV